MGTGEPVYCYVSESVAIAAQKAAIVEMNKRSGTNYVYKDDQTALQDFMVVHWAEFKEPPKKQEQQGDSTCSQQSYSTNPQSA